MYEISKDFGGWREWLSRLRRYFRLVSPLLKGLPALAAFGGVLYLAFTIASQRKDQLVGRYLDWGSQALRTADYRVARIGYERLTLLEPSRPEYRFGLALSLFALGEAQPAVGLMQGLAPPNERGFMPAHLWLGQRLLMGFPTQAERDAARVHLQRVLQEDPKDPDGNALMAHVYIGDNRYDLAQPYLLEATKYQAHPELELALAKMYAYDQKTEMARLHGKQALEFYQKLLDTDPTNHGARFGVADAAIFLGDHRVAVNALRDGLLATGDPAFRLALSRAHLRWAQFLARDPKSDLGDRLARLQEAIRLDFSNLPAFQELRAITRLKGPDADRARTVLSQLLAQGQSPALTHLMLGMLEQDQGQFERARQHFEQAYQRGQDMPVVVNNLAWMLAHTEPVDLPRALKLIDALVERFPKQANFRETRGQIYVKMKRWKEALADLESTLPSMNKSRAVHQGLAEAYKELGMPEQEAPHRKILEQLPVQ